MRLPDLQLTIRCGLPRERLARRIAGTFEHIPGASDFGLVMHSALDVDVAASGARYRAFHADWAARVTAEAQQLAHYQPDLVLSNISYLALAAAGQAHIPALALCSLNWAEIFYAYCSDAPDANQIRAQMLAAYNNAEVFLRLTPGMAMPGIDHPIDIGPVARCGESQRPLLNTALGLAPGERLVLMAMGGIAMRLPSMAWPSLPGLKWIVPQNIGLQRTDVIALETLDRDFSDVLASCDCVLTKSGYGTFVEAAACGTPVAYVERPDWPEEHCLVAWLRQHNVAVGIHRKQFDQGELGEIVWELATQPRATPIVPTGIDEAADCLMTRLEKCC